MQPSRGFILQNNRSRLTPVFRCHSATLHTMPPSFIVQAFSRGLLPTMPSADFSPAVNISCLMLSAEKKTCALMRSPGVRHVTFTARALDLQSASQTQMEGFAVTCPLAPNAPRLISSSCSSPRRFGFGFLQTLPRSNALAVSLAFGSAKTWLPDLHRHSYVPCPAHT